MSESVAIRVERLSKRFRLGSQAATDRITERLQAAGWACIRRPWQWLRGASAPRETVTNRRDEYWALDDVSFEVQRGEALGIVGRNGAGKSTLLKILTRVTEPTRGRFGIRGRVASLLEVGTGFHPDLTGRENIYLSGAFLGMSRQEIRRRFDEIVAFAEIDAFIDTPVKRYSSGMYTRLGFAVAAHLESEVLIVDEVLAVGDAAFQKKCLGKMHDTAQAGRTVLFVSHNMSAVSALCKQTLLLAGGKVQRFGATQQVLSDYRRSMDASVGASWSGDVGDDYIRLLSTHAKSQSPGQVFDAGAPIEITAVIELKRAIVGLVLGFRLWSGNGQLLVYSLFDDHEPPLVAEHKPGLVTGRWAIPANTLAVGEYDIDWEIGIAWQKHCVPQGTGSLTLRVGNHSGIGRKYPLEDNPLMTGVLRPNWQVH